MTVSMTYARVAPAITEVGYKQLLAELEHLRVHGRSEMAETLREVREDGELQDNPALLDTLEQQAQLEQRIALLSEHLAAAKITSVADGTAGVGCDVVVRDLDSGEQMHFQLVGEFEADASADRISVESPIGNAIHGLRAGAVVSAETPRGMRRLELLEVQADGTEPSMSG